MQTQIKHAGGTLTLFNAKKVLKESKSAKSRGRVSDDDLADFINRAQNKVNEDYHHFDNRKEKGPQLGITKGRKYARIVVMKHGREQSAFGFVDLDTGDVLKASGWSKPAKNFARGNIFDEHGGVKRVYFTGVQ